MPRWVEFLLVFTGPGGEGFELLFCPRVGNSNIKKIAGGRSGLELTDTLHRLAKLFGLIEYMSVLPAP